MAQVQFIENKGQWNQEVKFKSRAGDGAFFLHQNGFTVAEYSPGDVTAARDEIHENYASRKANPGAPRTIKSHAYRVKFLNSGNPEIIPEKPIPTINNYFKGDDPSKWAQGCKIYQAVLYKNIYPGIDVRYFVDGGSNLKYDFIVHPGAKVSDIAMRYIGADKLDIKKRELVISTSLGKSRSLQPYSYQIVNNQQQEVQCAYQIKGNIVSFRLKNYDPQKTLIIDPTEIFFSYSGSTADNWGYTATYGADGSFYGGGIVFGQGFPVSTGSFNESFNGDFDIGIIKLSADGKKRIYATYIGGSAQDQPHSLIENSRGNLVLAGRTNSNNYPVLPERNAESGSGGGYDIVVTELNATGSALVGSMRIGGSGSDGVNIGPSHDGPKTSLKRNYGDDARSEVLLDGADNIYVASSTSSTNFPIKGGVQSTLAGGQDAVVLKLNPTCTGVIFSTYLGGTGDDAAYVLAMGTNNNIYVAGGTGSTDFLGISASGVIKSTYSAPGSTNDPCDGFVVELSNDGSSILRGTYIGTGMADQIYGIDIDKFGYIYIMGTSEGNMPVINAAYSNTGAKQFIGKLEKDLSAYIYATVFGSTNAPSPNISPTAFMVDRCENVYVSGWGGKANGTFSKTSNVKGMPVTAGAIKSTPDDSGSDFYFFVLEKNAGSQLYGSFFGQNDALSNPKTFGDHVDGGTSRFDNRGYIYQAICANCFRGVAFPGTPGSWSPTNKAGNPNSGQCNLGMLKIEMDFAGVRANLQSTIDGVPGDSTGCIPLSVEFKDLFEKGKLYYWSYGDGQGDTTTAPNSSHTYTQTGTYQVRLISIDSATCNISDTVYGHIFAGDNQVFPDFTALKDASCTSLTYTFTNNSVAHGSGINHPGIFTWDFGDNTDEITADVNSVLVHQYAGPGTYQVKLTVTDATFCNSPQDSVKTIRLSPQVAASFKTPPAGCVPYEAVFENNSLGGLQFLWDFGDGTTSTEDIPTHLYSLPGTYKIVLFAYDSTSCNKVDSSSYTITVSDNPIASFTYSPLQPENNTFTDFTNQSIGAVSYLWDFGDGDSSTQVNPKHIFPSTGTFKVCLAATNSFGCTDDTCTDVKSLISPLLAVPTAFTPGKIGTNSRIGVAGFGIGKMQWKIYNRWGQVVFEGNSIKQKWDGTYQGKPQPMDVYSYTLKVTFTDGTQATKTGDITLIR